MKMALVRLTNPHGQSMAADLPADMVAPWLGKIIEATPASPDGTYQISVTYWSMPR